MKMILFLLIFIGISDAKCPPSIHWKKDKDVFKIEIKCYEDSKIKSKQDYRNGKRHGTYHEYYHTGAKKRESHYINGKKEGISRMWDSLGNIIFENRFKNGREAGLFQITFKGVKQLAERKLFDTLGEGKKFREEYWWPNGNPRYWAVYNHRQGPDTAKQWYPNGQMKFRLTDIEDSTGRVFKISMESWFPDGRPAGKIENGNGRLILFSDTVDYPRWVEVYQGGRLKHVNEIRDSVEMDTIRLP